MRGHVHHLPFLARKFPESGSCAPLTQAHTPKQKSRNCMSHKSPTLSQLPTSLPTAQAPISGPSMLGRRPCLAYSSLSVPVCTEIRRVARVFRRGAARTRNAPLSLAGSRAYPAKKTAPSTRNINTPSSPPRWQISSTSQLSPSQLCILPLWR